MIEPTSEEKEKLASLRDELLHTDWAYWHDDPGILFLNRILPGFPPFDPGDP
jgi:hypothetical protein